jgi:hypothetical protein
MLRRANDLVARARERIRLAAEHDPHAWPERDDDRAILVRDDELEPFEPAEEPSVEGDGATRPPLGSPDPAAPDLDGALGPGGVSGPPQGGRALRPGERGQRLLAVERRAGVEESVPNGLRTAAAWSWRVRVVVARF